MTAAWRGLQAAALLAVALKQHPHSPGLLLSLTALHTLLGNGERATATFLEASPRSVQLDALAHHITPSLAEMPSPKQKTMLRMACTPQALPRRLCLVARFRCMTWFTPGLAAPIMSALTMSLLFSTGARMTTRSSVGGSVRRCMAAQAGASGALSCRAGVAVPFCTPQVLHVNMALQAAGAFRP